MKTQNEVEKALEKFFEMNTNYHGMTYEEGVRNALDWVLENVADEDFDYAENA